jgi:hypothetical protein
VRPAFAPASCSVGDSSFVSRPASSGGFQSCSDCPEPETVALPALSPLPERAGTVEIEFAGGGRMRITGSVDTSTVSALIKALAKTRRRR